MRRLFYLGLSVATCVLVWQIVYVVLFSTRKRTLLQSEIRQRLQRLSVDFSIKDQPTTISPSALPASLTGCVIPVDAHSVCVDTIERDIPQPLCPLQQLSQNCELLTRLHGYDKFSDEEERAFPLAFGIKIHTDPELAERLLRTVYRPHNVYCIHVDRKSDNATFQAVRSIAGCFPNVFLTDRVDLVYSGPQMVEVELMLMSCALKTAVPWKYYLNLAGQEFPLRTNLEMVRILKMLKGSNDIASVPMPTHLQERITYVYKIQAGGVVRTTVRKPDPPFRTEIRKGTQYGAFSRAFVEALFHSRMAQAIMEFYSDTYSPDETVWATINSSPGAPGGYPVHVAHTPNNEHLSRAIAWQVSDSYACQGRYVRRVCIFSKRDLPWLLEQPNLLANKFGEDTESYQAVACLEAVLAQRARSRATTVDQSYVRNLPHVRFRRNTLR